MISVKRLCQKIGVFKKGLAKIMDDLLSVSGVILISFGTYQIYVPAGYIVLGIFLILAALVWSKGTEVNRNDIE